MKNPDLTKAIEEVFCHWISCNIVIHRKLTSGMEKKIKAALKDYTVEEIKESITNYGKILLSEDYYWTYTWPLLDFVSRGIPKFLTESKPFDNFATEEYKRNKSKKDFSDFRDEFKKWKGDSDAAHRDS